MRGRRGSFYISNGDAEERMDKIAKRKVLIPISRAIDKIEEENECEEEDERKINDNKISTVAESESVSEIQIVTMMVEEELEDRKDIGKSGDSLDINVDIDMFDGFEYVQERVSINESANNNSASGDLMTGDKLLSGLTLSDASASGDVFK